MSPFVLNRNAPLIGPPKGGQIGADSDEQAGIGKGGSADAGGVSPWRAAAAELDRIFRLESERTVSEDWVVRYENRYFQLQPQSCHYAPARSNARHGSSEAREGLTMNHWSWCRATVLRAKSSR